MHEAIAQQPVATALMAQMQAIAQRLPMPRVAALHIPQPAPGSAPHDAEFCALELDDGSFGLSYVLLGHTLQAMLQHFGDSSATAGHGKAPPALAGADPLRLAEALQHGNAVERALALAAMNAMTDSAWRRIGYQPPPAGNSLGDIDLTRTDHLGMIGFFPPLVARVHDAGGRLSVVEMSADTVARQQQRFPGVHITQDRAALATCNLVVGTSTMLLNDTLDVMLAAAPKARRFAVIGPSAGLWPDELFARGVTLMGGTQVVDGDALRHAMRSGQSWSKATRKFAVDCQSWPGWRQLLARH